MLTTNNNISLRLQREELENEKQRIFRKSLLLGPSQNIISEPHLDSN